jgi:hypothetical protein
METHTLLAYSCSISLIQVRCQEARGRGRSKRSPISRNFGVRQQTGSCSKTSKAPSEGSPQRVAACAGEGRRRQGEGPSLPGLTLLGYDLLPFRRHPPRRTSDSGHWPAASHHAETQQVALLAIL